MISVSDYEIVVDYIEAYLDDLSYSAAQLTNIQNTTSQMVTNNTDNIANLNYAAQMAYDFLGSLHTRPLSLIIAIGVLHRHVEKYYMTDINTFLLSNNIKVSQPFANVSNLTGYTISSAN